MISIPVGDSPFPLSHHTSSVVCASGTARTFLCSDHMHQASADWPYFPRWVKERAGIMRKSERTHSLARSPSSGQQIAAAVARDDGIEEGRDGRRGRGGRDGVARDDGTKGGLKLAATQNSASRSSSVGADSLGTPLRSHEPTSHTSSRVRQ